MILQLDHTKFKIALNQCFDDGNPEDDYTGVIMWTDSRGSAYVTSGYLTEEELEKVANSLYKK